MLDYINAFLLLYMVPLIITYFLAKFFWWVYPKQFVYNDYKPGIGTILLILLPFVNWFGLIGFTFMSIIEGIGHLMRTNRSEDFAVRFLRLRKEDKKW